MRRLTRKERLIACAKNGLYIIARGCPDPAKVAQGTLSAMAALKAASKEGA